MLLIIKTTFYNFKFLCFCVLTSWTSPKFELSSLSCVLNFQEEAPTDEETAAVAGPGSFRHTGLGICA